MKRGRPVIKAGRDFQIVQAYQLLLDERKTLNRLVKNHPELREWRDRLPSKHDDLIEALAKQFGLSYWTVKKIIDKNNKSVRGKRAKIKIGSE